MADAENFPGSGFIQWHMVVICIWCALFVTSQFDVIFMFPNQCFGEVCYTICIVFHTHSPYFMCHCTEYKLHQRSKLWYRWNIRSTLRHSSL